MSVHTRNAHATEENLVAKLLALGPSCSCSNRLTQDKMRISRIVPIRCSSGVSQ